MYSAGPLCKPVCPEQICTCFEITLPEQVPETRTFSHFEKQIRFRFFSQADPGRKTMVFDTPEGSGGAHPELSGVSALIGEFSGRGYGGGTKSL